MTIAVDDGSMPRLCLFHVVAEAVCDARSIGVIVVYSFVVQIKRMDGEGRFPALLVLLSRVCR